MIRTAQDFLNNLPKGDIYYRGRKIDSISKHPVLSVGAKHASKLFDVPGRVFKHNGEEYSLYYRVPGDVDDLIERRNIIYNTTNYCNGIFNISQAIGSDAIFAMMIVASKIDRKKGTNYSSRVEKLLSRARDGDLTLSVAQTDTKGDRSMRPGDQQDPDSYLHIVKKDERGIYVKGTKVHTTQAIYADELIVIPYRNMTDKEGNYAVAFSVQINTPGLTLIVRPIDELEGNTSALLSRQDYELETMTIFDNVFVPWENVYMCGEHEFAGELANLFATFHRFTAVSYRSATSNIYIGTAKLMAQANGISKAPHISNKILEMIMYKEIMAMSSYSAALFPYKEEGIAIPNPVYTNIGKIYSNENFSKLITGLIEISGGIMVTMPSMEDMNNSEEFAVIEKYLASGTNGKERIGFLRLAKELAGSSFTGYMLTLMAHAEGSIEASKIGLMKGYDTEPYEEMVQKIIKEGESE